MSDQTTALGVDDIFPYQTRKNIEWNITNVIRQMAMMQSEADRLTAEGCVWGNIVEEYRNVNGKSYGPYYRLTYYRDKNGHKAKPTYIPANEVEATQQKIENYAARKKLLASIEQIERDLNRARNHVEQLDRFLNSVGRECQQLVLPGLPPVANGNTK